MDPKSLEIIFALSDLHSKQGNIQLAIKSLQDHLSIHHNDKIHVSLAQLYLKIADFPKAMLHFNAAISYVFYQSTN